MTSARRTIVMISGNGSNLQAIIDQSKQIGIEIVAVISNKTDAYGLERARQAKLNIEVVERRGFNNRQEFDHKLAAVIDQYQTDLIVLAGFMHILEASLVRKYHGRIVNTHPSLLPKYPGLNTYQAVLAAGDTEHGISIHFVTEELDGGPVIAQGRLTIHNHESIASLQERNKALEHIIYPRVIGWLADNALVLSDQKITLDGKLLPPNGMQFTYENNILTPSY